MAKDKNSNSNGTGASAEAASAPASAAPGLYTAIARINHKGIDWVKGKKHLFVPGDLIRLTEAEAKKLLRVGAVKAGAPEKKAK